MGMKKKSIMGIESNHNFLPEFGRVRHSLTNNSVISLRLCYNTGLLPQTNINLQLCMPLAQLHFKGSVHFYTVYVKQMLKGDLRGRMRVILKIDGSCTAQRGK